MRARSPMEIGNIVAAARRHHKLTQSELAKAVGTTQAWISAVEQGKDTAQIGKVLRALSYLGVGLQTGVVPWGERKLAPSAPAGVSLSDIIAAHTAPQNRRSKK